MLKRLFLVAASAVCLAALAIAGLYLLAGAEEDILAAARRTLQTEVTAVEAEWRRTGAEVAQMATATAADASLGTDVRALVTTVEAYNPDAKLAKALGLRIDALRSRLSDRLLQLHHINPEVESIALMSSDGMVLAANSPRWVAGQSVLPAAGAAPGAPLPEFMLKGLTGSLQSGLWVDKSALWWVSVAPIWVHGPKEPSDHPTLAGVAVLEQSLRSLPAAVATTAFLLLDGEPLLGQPPKVMRVWPATPEPFVLVGRSTKASFLGLSIGMRPFFVETAHVGVWAQRLHVPGTDRAQGVVTLDLSDAYAAMASRQLDLLAATFGVWLMLAAMFIRRGWHLEHDVNQLADFLLEVSHGNPVRKVPEPLGQEARRLEVAMNKVLVMVAPRHPGRAAVEEPFGAGAPGDPLTDPAGAVDLVQSFMGGDTAGEAVRHRPSLLGDLPDTVAAPKSPRPSSLGDLPDTVAAPKAGAGRPAAAPGRPTLHRTMQEDPEAPTAPLTRPSAFAQASLGAGTARSARPSGAAAAAASPQASDAPAALLGGSARDQLMAMLQAKAKTRDAPARSVAPQTVPALHAVATREASERASEDTFVGAAGSEEESAGAGDTAVTPVAALGAFETEPDYGAPGAPVYNVEEESPQAPVYNVEEELPRAPVYNVEEALSRAPAYPADDAVASPSAYNLEDEVPAAPAHPADDAVASAPVYNLEEDIPPAPAYPAEDAVASAPVYDLGEEIAPALVYPADDAVASAPVYNLEEEIPRAPVYPADDGVPAAPAYNLADEGIPSAPVYNFEDELPGAPADDASPPAPVYNLEDAAPAAPMYDLEDAAALAPDAGLAYDAAGVVAADGVALPAAESLMEPAPDASLALEGTPGDAEPSPVLQLAAEPLGLEGAPPSARGAPAESSPLVPLEPMAFPPLGEVPAYAQPHGGVGGETPTLVASEAPNRAAMMAAPEEAAPPPAARRAAPAAAAPAPSPEEQAFRAVFEDFVRLRATCGEEGELPYDKFVARLQSTRADILAKHACSDVQFSAYVKNGKAALKVTPV